MIWFSPLIGITLYLLLGINRVQRRAVRRGARATGQRSPSAVVKASNPPPIINPEELPPAARHLAPLEHLVEELTDRDLLHGNRVEPLDGGDQAYPAMLAAIDSAEKTISLCSYIFNHDQIGKQFVVALGRAVRRGVQVRVMVDAIGSRYHFPSVRRALRQEGVPHAMFLPTLTPGRFSYSNLRTHRKLLIVDGREGFTGGMNIQEGESLGLKPAYPIQDLHFHLAGPIVRQMQEVFINDWEFCASETLSGDDWLPELSPEGTALARGISAGPDEDVDKRRLTLMGAIGCARSTILIVTPYFLPDDGLIAALDVAALRGVTVDIVLPAQNNLQSVQWASMSALDQVLQRGCRVWFSPPPFDHTKLMVVDSAWTMFGSGNWDPRSLRLNFEFDIECYDEPLATAMQRLACQKRDGSRRVTLAELSGRSIPVKLRDGVARLLTPYL
jgi:cardiolipin synthase